MQWTGHYAKVKLLSYEMKFFQWIRDGKIIKSMPWKQCCAACQPRFSPSLMWKCKVYFIVISFYVLFHQNTYSCLVLTTRKAESQNEWTYHFFTPFQLEVDFLTILHLNSFFREERLPVKLNLQRYLWFKKVYVI